MATAAWLSIVLSCLALAATIGGIYFVRESLREARSATRFAGQQVDLSRHALISTDRAMVFYEGCRYLSYHRDDGTIFWGITINWTNKGSTPAINLKLGINSWISELPLPDDWAFETNVASGQLAMAPGSGLSSRPEIRLEPEQIIAAATGKLNVYIWGTATYNDVFENTPPHETRFLVTVNGYTGDVTKYFDEDKNPVRIYLGNHDRNQFFS